MRRLAPAKINWDLLVLGKRPDGFHELDTVMVTIGLADEMSFERSSSITMTCTDPRLPCDDRNLVIKAAKIIANEAEIETGARIELTKRIPWGGGLGGGSSDAATTIMALNELWDLHWERDRLARIAAQVGSDVAFFLWGGWCRCRGRGELIEPLVDLNELPPTELLLILPDLSVSTPAAYKALDAGSLPATEGARSLTDILEEIRICRSCVSIGSNPRANAGNSLIEAAVRVEPLLLKLQEVLQKSFPGRWFMSGSGATHFVLGSSIELDQEKLQSHLEMLLPFNVRVVKTATAPLGSSS